ncbi:MAG TPA: succinate dehydrogenase, hydrophobic membrane anchor protein [Acetobacteraceae bacterium]
MRVDILRSQLGRARGLGSARAGSGHWWRQRLTALALVPLTLWFICAAIRLEGAGRADVVAWLHSPVPLVLMLCLIVATFLHLELGLRVVIEDYVHRDPTRMVLLLGQRALCILLAVFCIIAALELGL